MVLSTSISLFAKSSLALSRLSIYSTPGGLTSLEVYHTREKFPWTRVEKRSQKASCPGRACSTYISVDSYTARDLFSCNTGFEPRSAGRQPPNQRTYHRAIDVFASSAFTLIIISTKTKFITFHNFFRQMIHLEDNNKQSFRYQWSKTRFRILLALQ